MSKLTDHVSYIKGLAEGLNLDMEKSEGKIIAKILDLLDDMAKEFDKIHKDHEDLNEYVESIDNDLADIEEIIYDDDEDEDCEDCDEDDCGCGHCHCGDEDDEDQDEEVVEYTCPHCGESMTFEVQNFDFDEDYLCPTCHQPLFPETPDEN